MNIGPGVSLFLSFSSLGLAVSLGRLVVLLPTGEKEGRGCEKKKKRGV